MFRMLLRNSRWSLIFSMLAGLGSGLGGVGLLIIANRALSKEHGAELMDLGLAFAGLCVLLLLSRGASSFLLMRVGQDTVLDLRLKLSHRILTIPFPRLQALGSARILACLTQDVATLAETFQWLPMLCVNGAIVIGCIAYLGWLSKFLLVLVGVAIILGIGGFRYVETRALKGLRLAREYDDALHAHFQTLAHGIKELKLHQQRRDDFMGGCLESAAVNYRHHYSSAMGLYIVANNWGNGLFYLLIGVVLFVVPLWLELTPEVLRGYCLMILYMMTPLQALVDGLPLLGRASVSVKKIEALICEAEEAGTSAPGSPRIFPQPAILELNGVTHRYFIGPDERQFMVGPVNLTLYPGEVIFLVGGNGSGKTTLLLLLAGLYTPERGDILLAGRRVSGANRESYRQQFSAVFSDFHLFDSLLGLRKETLDSEAQMYLAELQLDHKVRITDGEFSTIKLSQGQRKRLALLVAYLEDRPFYLFDEWAADQDPVFKKLFYLDILPILKSRGKTVVVITHDDSYFYVADRCLKLDEGKVMEMAVRRY